VAGQRQHQYCHPACGSVCFVGFATRDVAEYNPGYTVPFPSHSRMARRWEAVVAMVDELAVELVTASF